jgi:hypothetical protein
MGQGKWRNRKKMGCKRDKWRGYDMMYYRGSERRKRKQTS